MSRPFALAVVLFTLLPAPTAAHRLDEYLQACRVALGPDGIRLEIDLTPGVQLAASIVNRIDTDHDGRVSGHEAERYARAVLSDLEMRLDQTVLELHLQRVEVATPIELLDGVGVISIVATTPVSSRMSRHQMTLRNNHEPARSVYLMNALLPETNDVVMTAQTRDARQQEFTIEYGIRASSAATHRLFAPGVLLGAMLAAVAVRFRSIRELMT